MGDAATVAHNEYEWSPILPVEHSRMESLTSSTWQARCNEIASKTLAITYLTVSSVIPDLICFTILEYIGLVIFAASSVVFSFIDFNHLTDPANNPSLYNVVNDREAGVERWRRTLMLLSGAAAFTGVLSVVLTTKGKLTAFFWGAINSIFYGLFAYAYGYAGDAQLNLFFYLPVQFWGLWAWGSNILDKAAATADDESTVESLSLSLWLWCICIVISGGIAVGFFYEIPVFAVAISGVYYFEHLPVPRSLDAIANALSMVAQVLSIYRFREQWYWWIAVDVVQIAMFTGIAGYGIVINVLVMWCLFLLNALAGLYAWHVRQSNDDGEVSGAEKKRLDEGDVFDPEAAQHMIVTTNNTVALEGECKTSAIADEIDLEDPNCELSRDPRALGNGCSGWVPPLNPPTSHRTKKPIRGFVIGKFWPFHRGHQHLVETAVAQCDEVYVVICHRPNHHPSALLRQQALRETCPDKVYSMIIRDVYDQVDSALWAHVVKVWCGFVPDLVFTSETYGEAFVHYLGHPCRHVLVDQERHRYPVSGTQVRAQPAAFWSFLSPVMRRYYCRRIVVVGAESTGKSTLIEQLAAHYASAWVPEYGREFCEEQLAARALAQQATTSSTDNASAGSGSKGPVTSPEDEDPEEFTFTDADFAQIIREQARREDNAAAADSNVHAMIFCDTNPWVTLQWYIRYQRQLPPTDLLQLQRSSNPYYASHETTLYLFCETNGTYFVQDGVRDGRYVREDMNVAFRKALDAEALPYVTITGRFEERLPQAIALVDAWLKRTQT